SQPSGRGIQDAVEKSLMTFCRDSVRVIAASRTDTGVHADAQVVIFRSQRILEPFRLVKGLNALLPACVRVAHVEVCAQDFHPIFHSTGKAYRYRIWRSAGEHPALMPYVWQVTSELDIATMRAGAKLFLGEHDFTSFCAADSSAKS